MIIKTINDKKYLLVIFNSGKRYPKEFYENIQYNNDYLESIYNIIIEYHIKNNFSKILLCGHSMGATNSIFLTLFLIKNYEDFFVQNCLVLISGMSNILNNEEIEIL